jgi:hypothetical protein
MTNSASKIQETNFIGRSCKFEVLAAFGRVGLAKEPVIAYGFIPWDDLRLCQTSRDQTPSQASPSRALALIGAGQRRGNALRRVW